MKLETLNGTEPQEISSGASATPPQADFLDILILLARRRRFILQFTAIVAVLTTIVVFLIPNKYTATSVLLPPKSNNSLSSALMGDLAGSSALASLAGASLGIKSQGDMYVALFRSHTVEDALIKQFGLMKRYHKKTMVDTRKKFEDRAEVELGAKDGLITVSVTDYDPRFAAQLANAYVQEFRKHTDTLSITEASQRRKFFQQQLQTANQTLTDAEVALKKTEQSTGVVQLDSQASALVESAAVLRAQITARQVELQAMRASMTEDNPQYVLVQQQLDALQAQLGRIAGKGGTVGSGIGLSKGSIPAAGMAYLDSLRDVRYYETIVELLAKQYELAKLDEAREGTIQISDVAIPPDKKSSPWRSLIIILGSIFALVCACGWCIFRQALDDMKQNPSQRERLMTLRGLFEQDGRMRLWK